jgi:DNA-binding NarL/FixJ family response regulator
MVEAGDQHGRHPRGAGLRTLPRDEAVAVFEHAVDLLTDSSAQLEHARALVEFGAALRRTNRRAAARDPLRRALDLCDRGGMVVLGRRARQELHAAGGRPRRNALSGPGALTPAEHRVTRLAAQGLGNRAIAERLYVTERTVETHLTHAFQKLGIGSRTELAATLEPPQGTSEPALTS